jgi:biopolymer transport protein ExbB
MYPILLVFAVGMAIAFERWVQLNRIRSANQRMWTRLHPVLVKGSSTKPGMVNKDKSSMAQMLGMGWRARVRCGAAKTSKSPWKRA